MTTATNTSLGEIKLAGDLAGNNDGLAPALTTVLSTPGAFVLPTITVDAKGRTTAVSNTSGASIAAFIPDATTSSKGVVKIGANINIDNTSAAGYQVINYGGTLLTSTSTALCNNGASYSFELIRDSVGPLKVELTASSLNTVANVISAINAVIAPFVISLSGGNLKITSGSTGTNSSVSIINDFLFQYITGYIGISTAVLGTGDGTISVSDASSTVKGVAKFSSDFTVSGGAVSLTLRDATASVKGVVQVGSGLDVSSGVISTTAIPDATSSSKGLVQVGSGLSVTAGVVSADPIADATTSSKGLVQVGTGLSVTAGVVSADPIADATTSSKGLVQVGSGLEVTAGVLSTSAMSDATTSTKGVVQVGAGLAVTGGVISSTTTDATTSTKGAVQVGSGLSVSAGVISADPIVDATTSSKGLVQVGSGINVSAGVISVPNATGSVKGLVQVGAGLAVSSGVLSTVSMADATTTSKGIVQVGSGLSVTGGIISAPDASIASKGAVQVGSGLAVTAGVLRANLPDATTSSKGIVQVGSNLSISSGVISVAEATASVKGVVKIGSGINVAAGVISVPNGGDATTSTKGVVQVGNGLSVSSGVLSVNTAQIALINANNTWSQSQSLASSTMTSASTVTPQGYVANLFRLTAAHNFTLVNINAPLVGAIYRLVITQDGTGSRIITWDSYYKFNTAAPTLSTVAGKTDVFEFLCLSSTQFLCTSVIKGIS